ncbi:helix-turn-helix domain-containing protein [Nocardia sp. NPDC058518]|uniref:helix-turn-helix domain-containing protein n=1 Tax=Nocardia sp. NPDC058518 TaxID=3346534 RepID=UPI003658E3F2
MPIQVGIADFLSAAAAARVIGVTDVTVQRWAKSGRIAATKLPGSTGAYLIARADVDRAAAERSARKDAA